jgi:uncharacterized membrane protein
VPPEASPNAELTQVVHRNIRALLTVQREFERKKSAQDKLADSITTIIGSLYFVYIQLVFVCGWIALNARLFRVEPFDPFPFVMLAMITSVEAIFLSTFVLISQNRQAAMNQRRADLDLQINLLAEHEITRLIKVVDALAHKLGVDVEDAGHMAELERDVSPEDVLEEIEREEEVAQRDEEDGPPARE